MREPSVILLVSAVTCDGARTRRLGPRRLQLLGIAVLLAASRPGVVAQSLPIRLADPIELPQGFTRLSGVIELGDRVIVADRGESTLWKVDFATGTGKRVLRQGEGPGEYRDPGRLFQSSRDTAVLFDAVLKRFTVLGPDLRYVRSRVFGRAASARVRGLDHEGHLFYEETTADFQRPPPAGFLRGARGGESPIALVPVLRVNLETLAPDTICFVRLPPRRTDQRSMVAETPGAFGLGVPFGEQDDWTLDPAGLVAVVRATPYRVEWYRGAERVDISPVITDLRVAVTEADKEAWWDRMRQDSIILLDCRREPCVATAVHRPVRPTEWPRTKNPFEPGLLVLSATGGLWISRAGSAADTRTVYDVVTRGVGVQQVVLSPGRRVEHVGERFAYVSYEDEDGLRHLVRYRLLDP